MGEEVSQGMFQRALLFTLRHSIRENKSWTTFPKIDSPETSIYSERKISTKVKRVVEDGERQRRAEQRREKEAG